jgi:hypothetical protein
MPKPGWLNRQFDQVSKNVEVWPDWMKRAAGFETGGEDHQSVTNTCQKEHRAELKQDGTQTVLQLK